MSIKDITIISTYPKEGSMNIGDALITNSLKELINDEAGDNLNINFHVVWRADEWDNVSEIIKNSDLIVFACLAIRNNLSNQIYPYLSNIIALNKKVLVISAGTALGTTDAGYNFATNKNDFEILNWLNENAVGFTSRALLTQYFCIKNDLNNVIHSGDIAFYDKRFNDRKFNYSEVVNRIIISDPHYPKLFLPALKKLVLDLKYIFPEASLDINLHGRNPEIETFAEKENIRINDIYKSPDAGLDNYDEYDLHIGFRIHGHISMLKRRKPSYLIEQDGRGIDYGLTLNRQMSVKSHVNIMQEGISLKTLFKKILIKNTKKKILDLSCVDELLAIVNHDKQNSFEKFLGYETEISKYNENHQKLIRSVLNKL